MPWEWKLYCTGVCNANFVRIIKSNHLYEKKHTAAQADLPVPLHFLKTQNAKLLRAQAQISQITSAPEAAAMKVKGMPMRMKSPVETL